MIVTSLSVLRRASEYTCNISSENTQIFNFCELVFFFPPKGISIQEEFALYEESKLFKTI